MPDQVRLHHVIFLEKVVLAAIAWTNDAFSTQTHMVLFRSGNKLSHMSQKSQIVADPWCLIHSLFPIHNDRNHLAHIKGEK